MDRALVLVLVLVVWSCVLVSPVAGEEGCGGPLAANFPEGRSSIYVASGLAQSFHVKKTSCITSFVSLFWTLKNGTVLQSLAIHSHQASKPGPGPALAGATFNVASVPFAVRGENERRTFNATRPEGILLTPGHYWLVAMLPGSMGWMFNFPAMQDPTLPLTVLGFWAVGLSGHWTVHNETNERIFALGFNGCRAEEPTPSPPHKGGDDDDDAGTMAGIVLGVLAAIGLIGAAAVGLAVWIRKQRSTVHYQAVDDVISLNEL